MTKEEARQAIERARPGLDDWRDVQLTLAFAYLLRVSGIGNLRVSWTRSEGYVIHDRATGEKL
jgi:hypothetical protein